MNGSDNENDYEELEFREPGKVKASTTDDYDNPSHGHHLISWWDCLCISVTPRAMSAGVFFFFTPGRVTHAEQFEG